MTRPRIRAALATAVREVAETMGQDELAYLAVTSKVELPIRDRLAWLLHRSLAPDFVVSREWRRADLAVLDGTQVEVQVEAKAMYSFDVLADAQRRAYANRLRADAVKMHQLAPDSDAYLLALITDITGDIPPHLRRHVVKYSAGIRAAAKLAGPEGTAASARAKWLAELDAFGAAVVQETLIGGSIWGLRVTVDAFLIGPISRLAAAPTAATSGAMAQDA